MYVSKPIRFVLGFATLFASLVFAFLWLNQGKGFVDGLDMSYNNQVFLARTSYTWVIILGALNIWDALRRSHGVPAGTLTVGCIYTLAGLACWAAPIRATGISGAEFGVVFMALGGITLMCQSLVRRATTTSA